LKAKNFIKILFYGLRSKGFGEALVLLRRRCEAGMCGCAEHFAPLYAKMHFCNAQAQL